MKAIVLPISIFLSVSANASFFQTYCSNAEGTVKWSQGHNDNTLVITKRSWEGGNLSEETLTVPQWEITYKVNEEKDILSEASSNCPADSDWGVAKWRTVKWQAVELKRQDGSPFHSDVVGVNSQGAINTILICEEKGNSQSYCGTSPSN